MLCFHEAQFRRVRLEGTRPCPGEPADSVQNSSVMYYSLVDKAVCLPQTRLYGLPFLAGRRLECLLAAGCKNGSYPSPYPQRSRILGGRVAVQTRSELSHEAIRQSDAALIFVKLRKMIASDAQPTDTILGTIAVAAHSLTGATGAAVAMPRDGTVICVGRSGETAPELGDRLNLDSGISGECLRTGVIMRCDDARRSKNFHCVVGEGVRLSRECFEHSHPALLATQRHHGDRLQSQLPADLGVHVEIATGVVAAHDHARSQALP